MMKGLSQSLGLKVSHGVPGKFLAFLRSCLKYQPDYIHVDWLHSYYIRRKVWMTWLQFPVFLIEIFLVKNIFRTKIVWTLHNIFPHDQPFFGPFKWARRYFAKNCEWIRIFQEGTLERALPILKVGIDKFKVVPEGSYAKYYPNSIKVDEAKRRLGLPANEKVLLYLGLIRPYKGITELIEVNKQMKMEKTRLLIVGKSMNQKYLQRIENLASENVEIIEGFVPPEKLQLYFNAADLVVLPFKKIENSGSAILAMGFKKPIVAPNLGVLSERLQQQHELLFEEGEMAKILGAALAMDKSKLRKIGLQNYKALEKYKWEDFASCY